MKIIEEMFHLTTFAFPFAILALSVDLWLFLEGGEYEGFQCFSTIFSAKEIPTKNSITFFSR